MVSDKNALLDLLERRVESHIKIAIGLFQNLQEEVMLKEAIDGGWSIAQCLEHLNSYGRYYLPEINNGLKTNFIDDTRTNVNGSGLGKYFAKIMEPTTGLRKFKAFKGHVPASALNAEEVVAEFIEQQEKLLGYIQDARKKNLRKIRIAISISKLIRLHLEDVFQFLIAHNERHIQQALRAAELH